MNIEDVIYEQEGSLYLDGKNLPGLAKKYGTPIIVYSKRKIQENVGKLRKAFSGGRTSIHFSIKSNYNPFILRMLQGMNVGVDAATPNEVALALKVGFPAEKIIATPNNMSREDLLSITRQGVVLNFDDISQMKLLGDDLPEVVSFRINPGIGRGQFKGIKTGGRGSKFGIPPEVAVKAYRLAKRKGVKRFGIHMMTGSNVLDPSFFDRSSYLFFRIADRIARENGIEFEFLDIGGGFGVPYNMEDKELDVDEVGHYILRNFSKFSSKGQFRDSQLILEPGRFIIANAGVLLASVTGVKRYDNVLVGMDVSMNTLIRIPLYGAVHPVFVANRTSDSRKVSVNLVGQVCENTDILFRSISLPRLEVGDTIAILNCGAYVTSMSSNYNLLARPMEIMIDGSKERVIRRRETIEDILQSFENV